MCNSRLVSALKALAVGVVGVSAFVSGASAHVVRIAIEDTQTAPATKHVVAYTTVRGKAFGELDPSDARNRIIQDIDLAPRNARGRVEYAADFTLSFPASTDHGSGVLMYEAANRGTPIADLALGVLAADGASDDFLLRQRLIVLRSAWQGDASRADAQFGPIRLRRLALDVPVAKPQVDQTSDAAGDRSERSSPALTGPVRAEIIVTQSTYTAPLSGAFAQGHRTYEPVSLDDPSAVLTWRRRERDERQPIDRSEWRFADCSTTPFPGLPSSAKLCLKGGFDPNRIYELIYAAKDPLVLGIGLAATRDIVSFFRHAATDEHGTPNPVRDRVRHSIGLGISQSGNFLKTFVHLGFNVDHARRRVFDGLMPIVASRTTALNIRFGQPGRGAGQHEDHLYPGHNAPSTWSAVRDEVAGRRAGLLDRCSSTRSCPRVMQILSASEYWQLQASPTHVDATGTADIALPDNVRLYFISGTQHTPAQAPSSDGICVYSSNPAPTRETVRALFVALTEWLVKEKAPPPSVYPTLAAQQLVPPAQVRWPTIPGVSYLALANPMPLLDFGPEFVAVDESGIISREPPAIRGEYAILVPQVDADGIDLGGIRTTATAVPLGSHSGWNYRKPGFAAGELCSLTGSYFPLARTRAERVAAHDPRPSLEERYGDHGGYVEKVRSAAERLLKARLLLPHDAERLVAEAEEGSVLR